MQYQSFGSLSQRKLSQKSGIPGLKKWAESPKSETKGSDEDRDSDEEELFLFPEGKNNEESEAIDREEWLH